MATDNPTDGELKERLRKLVRDIKACYLKNKDCAFKNSDFWQACFQEYRATMTEPIEADKTGQVQLPYPVSLPKECYLLAILHDNYTPAEEYILPPDLRRPDAAAASQDPHDMWLLRESLGLIGAIKGPAASEKLDDLERWLCEVDARAELAKQSGRGGAAVATVSKKPGLLRVAWGGSLSVLPPLAFELCVHLIPWAWMRDHPNTLPLQIGGSILLFLACLGLLVPQWRKWCWGGGALLSLALMLLEQLGGKSAPSLP